ncbi:MFS transporter, partial [bacterium]|nr:MFS transporter [bacterium]
VGVLVFRPMIGKQVDNLGRKAVLVLGAVVFIISPILYLFIDSIAVLVPVRVFHGLGLAAFGTASITLITDVAPLANRGEVLSYTGMINTVAFTLGPIAGGYVGETWGYQVLFVTVAIASVLCFITVLFLKETRIQSTSPKQINYMEAILQRRILVAFLIILLISVTHGGVIAFIPIFVKENFTLEIGLFFAVFGVSTLAIRIFIGRVADTWGRGPLIIFALLFLTVGVYLLSLSESIWFLLMAAVIYGFGFGAQQPTLTALVADNTTEDTRGKIFSFYYGGFDLGISISGLMMGIIAERFGIPIMFVVGGALTFAAMIAFVFFFEKTIASSLHCAFNLKTPSRECYICDQYQEVPGRQAAEYFKAKPREESV